MLAKNLICILDVDIQGVKRIKDTDLNPIYISIQPPSMEILVNVHLLTVSHKKKILIIQCFYVCTLFFFNTLYFYCVVRKNVLETDRRKLRRVYRNVWMQRASTWSSVGFYSGSSRDSENVCEAH